MLCLFWVGCAFFGFWFWPLGKLLKSRVCEFFEGGVASIPKNLKKVGGQASRCLKDASERAQKTAALEKSKYQNQESDLGNWSLLLYYIFIFIFILINSLVQTITLAYGIYYLLVQFFTHAFYLIFAV